MHTCTDIGTHARMCKHQESVAEEEEEEGEEEEHGIGIKLRASVHTG